MKLVRTLLLFFCVWCYVEARCVMRKVCTEIQGFPKNCPFDDEPQPMLRGLTQELRQEVISNLIRRCPTFILDEDGNQKPDDEILTCCDHIQLAGLAESLLLADGALGRCPTCIRNFARQICEMNCAPDQARFVSVYTEWTADNQTEYVNEIDYRMHESFMDDAHASCSGVIVPQTGVPAINLMCGGAPVCDAQAWFSFTGDVNNNPLAPVQVNFLRMTTLEDSMHVRAPPCNETSYDDLPCNCIDCFEVCPIGVEPNVPETCTVLSIHCAGFGVSIALLFIIMILLIFFTKQDYKKAKKLKNERNVKPSESRKPKISKMNKFFQIIFTKIGAFSARNSLLMIMLSTWIGFALFFGFLNLRITSNPLELWSAPDSRSRAELEYFNSRFGPFYRASQVFLQFTGLQPFTVDNQTFGPAFHLEAVEEIVKLEDAILNIGRDTGGVVLEQVCYAPLRARGGEERLNQCVTMSVATYFGDDRHNINNNTYLNRIQTCINNNFAFECQASWGGGADPEITFGGYSDDILQADTLLINLPLNNYLLAEDLRPVLEWEQGFLDLLHDYNANQKPDYVRVVFGTERSVEDEIQRVSQLEATPIIISYFLMFFYVLVSLGNVRSIKTFLVESKVTVAIGSILTVIFSVYCAMGTMGYGGITLTLLAINVVPFFVLSIGIDNVFLMVNTLHDLRYKLKEFDDYRENFNFDEKREFLFGKMLGKVGPSMFVSSITQITCFAIGSLANFPAVQTFAVFVSISLGYLFLFQITVIVAILSFDYKRESENRIDILCCIQKKILNDSDPLLSDTPYESIIKKIMVPYSKFLLKWWVKIIVSLVFLILLCASIMMIPQIEVGLDQEMSLPPDSYMYAYLQAVNNLMQIGPPVFFVVKSGLNFTDPNHQNTICGGQLCYEDSLNTQLFLASRFTNITYLARSSNSWIDDFFDWSSLTGACCKFNVTDGSFCRSLDNSPECVFCDIPRDDWQNGLRPSREAFKRYIPFFLQDDPSEFCSKGGLASYFSSVNYVLDANGDASVHDTSFMAYHKSLVTSYDYITALKFAYEIADNITAAIKVHTGVDAEVFPYSIFYVYFEQYLTMWYDTFASIGYCLIGAFLLNLFASGFDFLSTFAVMCTAGMVVIDMMGIMYIWNIPLNAVSCVNLIVSIGIGVEFCSHISYAFTTSTKPNDERITHALEQVGPTIITGITFTNIPIIVLAFSYTEIIEVFFFRMLFSLVILGFLHGMIFFPVFLSYLSDMNLFCSKKSNAHEAVQTNT